MEMSGIQEVASPIGVAAEYNLYIRLPIIYVRVKIFFRVYAPSKIYRIAAECITLQKHCRNWIVAHYFRE